MGNHVGKEKVCQYVTDPDERGIGKFGQQRPGIAFQTHPKQQRYDAQLRKHRKRILEKRVYKRPLLVQKAGNKTEQNVAHQRGKPHAFHQTLYQRAENQQDAQGDEDCVLVLHRLGALCRFYSVPEPGNSIAITTMAH